MHSAAERDNPINAIDVDGRETYVITTFHNGVGTHSAVMVARNGDHVQLEPRIYHRVPRAGDVRWVTRSLVRMQTCNST